MDIMPFFAPLIIPVGIILGVTIYKIIDRICKCIESRNKNKEK